MKYSGRFVVVAAFFVTALVVSNIIAVKLVEGSGPVFPAGLVIFPLSYLLGDVLTEVYGIRAARRVIWLGFACNLLALGAIQAAIHLPAADFWMRTRAPTRRFSARPGDSSSPRSPPTSWASWPTRTCSPT